MGVSPGQKSSHNNEVAVLMRWPYGRVPPYSVPISRVLYLGARFTYYVIKLSSPTSFCFIFCHVKPDTHPFKVKTV